MIHQLKNTSLRMSLFRILASISILTTSFMDLNAQNILQISESPSLAYIRDGDIWVMDVGNPPGAPITKTGIYSDMSWSPDGPYLLARTSDDYLHLINKNSTEILEVGEICNQWVFSLNQAWAPNGQYLLVQNCIGQYNNYDGFSAIDIEGNVIISFSDKIWLPVWGNESNELYYFKRGPISFNKFKLSDLSYEVILDTTDFSSVDAWYPLSNIFPASGSQWMAITPQDGPDTPIHNLIFLSSEGIIYGDPYVEYPIYSSTGSNTGLIANPYFWTFLTNWSPDGTKFVYPIEGDPSEQADYPSVLIFDVLSRKREVFWTEGGINPAWSPDGTMISLTTQEGGLVVIDVNSKEERYLLSDAPQSALIEYHESWTMEFSGYFPSRDMKSKWSPDGNYIVFNYPDKFFIIDVQSGKQVGEIRGMSPKWIPNLTEEPLLDDQVTKCGTWHTELISRELVLPRISVQSVQRDDVTDCRGDFILINTSGLGYASGYSLHLNRSETNATATWWSEYGSWENRDYLPSFMDIELRIQPENQNEKANVILEGDYNIHALTIDLGMYLLRLAFSIIPSTGAACVLPEERILFEAGYSFVGLASTVELALQGKFLQAVYELATVSPQFIEYTYDNLKNVLNEMGVECSEEVLDADFLVLSWQAITWLGMYGFDRYLFYGNEPVQYRFYYEP